MQQKEENIFNNNINEGDIDNSENSYIINIDNEEYEYNSNQNENSNNENDNSNENGNIQNVNNINQINDNNDNSIDNSNEENNNDNEDNNNDNEENNNDNEDNNNENEENNNNNEDNNNENEENNISTFSITETTIYYYNKSKDLFFENQYKKSLIYINIYIKLVPNNPKSFQLKAKILSKLEKYTESLSNFEKSIKLGDDSIENIYGCAKAYKELNQFDKAINLYKKGIEINPSPTAFFLFGTCLYSMGNKEEAIEYYNKSIKLNPNYAEAFFNKGICLSNLKYKEEAIQNYDKAISINPNFTDAYFQRGYCLYNIKKYQLSMQDMNKVLELNPNYYQAYYEKGFCFLKMKRIEEAIIEITKAIEQNPNFENAYFQRGYCYELLKNYKSAIDDYYKVIKLNNLSYKVFYRLGICLININKIDEALEMFNKAIDLNRANYEAYYFKGMCQRKLKLYEDAIITFNYFLNCIKLNERICKKVGNFQIMNAYLNKAKCLFELNRFKEAIGMFNEYIKNNNNNSESFYKRAICFYETKQYKESINDLSYIINNFKNNFCDITIESSEILTNLNEDSDDDISDSVYYCETEKKTGESNENFEKVYLLRGEAFFQLNDIRKALSDFNDYFNIVEKKYDLNKKTDEDLKTISIKDDLTRAFFKRGYCYLDINNYSLAFNDFENTVKLNESYITSYFNMAICLSKLNKQKDAIKYYSKFLKKYPDDIEAHIGIIKCYRKIGNIKHAYELSLDALEIFKENIPKKENLFYESGLCLLDLEKYNEAIEYFDKAINLSKKNSFLSECYFNKGLCFSKLNNKTNALMNFDKALEYNDKNEDIFNYKAHCLMVLEKYDEAIKSYINAIDLNKEKYTMENDGYFNIGFCYIKLKNFNEALKYFNLSKNINESKIKEYLTNSLEMFNSGKAENCLLEIIKFANELKPKFIDLNYYIGICNKELNENEIALNCFDMCNKYDEKFSESYYNKGLIFSKLNKSNEAIELYNKAIKCENKQIYRLTLNNEKKRLKKKYHTHSLQSEVFGVNDNYKFMKINRLKKNSNLCKSNKNINNNPFVSSNNLKSLNEKSNKDLNSNRLKNNMIYSRVSNNKKNITCRQSVVSNYNNTLYAESNSYDDKITKKNVKNYSLQKEEIKIFNTDNNCLSSRNKKYNNHNLYFSLHSKKKKK